MDFSEQFNKFINVNQHFFNGKFDGSYKRIYYCQRCLNHDRVEPRKNHKNDCPFISCNCSKCILVEKRRILNTQLQKLELTKTENSNIYSVDRNTKNLEISTITLESDFTPTLNNDVSSYIGYQRIKGERVPSCQKCGQHGRKSRLKGHKRACPFKDCNCAKCQVVTERQKLMADQIKIRRRQRKDTIMTLTRDNLKVLNSITAAAVANPQPYINNLSNLNMLCKQISAQQPSLDNQDLENQQPMQQMQFNSNSNMIPSTSFHQISQTNSSAFSPASKADSPQLVSSPLSTIGTEMSLSPQQFPRANSFDLGLLSNQNSLGQQQQLLSALTASQQLQDLKQIAPTSNSNGFELTPPQSAGLVAPIPVNPIQQTGNQLSYDNLLALSQLLAPQQQMVSAPSLLQFINPQQPTLNLQDLLSVATLLQQFQGQQLSPPPNEKPHKPNGFVDVCSV